ncbi:MAG: type II toxin-antitoxin system Phd/YefM family antitoxin [Bacteroidales bacterium]|nr:type II toxin-antitoxin system Phd/YefM family antitoxin [Bacteroidales bacterium]
MNVWQLQEAKSKFSQLVEEAIHKGPQIVTKRGIDAVVVLSKKEFSALSQQKISLIDLFKSAPKIDLKIDRRSEGIRDIEF